MSGRKSTAEFRPSARRIRGHFPSSGLHQLRSRMRARFPADSFATVIQTKRQFVGAIHETISRYWPSKGTGSFLFCARADRHGSIDGKKGNKATKARRLMGIGFLESMTRYFRYFVLKSARCYFLIHRSIKSNRLSIRIYRIAFASDGGIYSITRLTDGLTGSLNKLID